MTAYFLSIKVAFNNNKNTYSRYLVGSVILGEILNGIDYVSTYVLWYLRLLIP